jgi:hypothetical protein
MLYQGQVLLFLIFTLIIKKVLFCGDAHSRSLQSFSMVFFLEWFLVHTEFCVHKEKKIYLLSTHHISFKVSIGQETNNCTQITSSAEQRTWGPTNSSFW